WAADELRGLMAQLSAEPAVQGRGLLHLGELAKRQGDNEASERDQQKALEYFERAGDRQGYSDALSALGFHAVRARDHERATALLTQALELKEAIADRQGTGQVLNNLGLQAFRVADYERALELIERSLEIFRAMGSLYSVGTGLINLGLVQSQLRRYDAADASFQQALHILQSVGDRVAASVCLTNQGLVAINRLDRARARHLFREARRLKLESDSQWGMHEVLINLAWVAAWDGEFEAAERMLRTLLDREGTTPEELSVVHTMLGVLHIFNGNMEGAVLTLHRAVADAEDHDNPGLVALCRANVAFYAAVTRQDSQFKRLAEDFSPSEPLTTVEPRAWVAWLHDMAAETERAKRRKPRRIASLKEAVERVRKAFGLETPP
ncbi:MAG: tetratricopeptide repeat protein, partial [Myxococcota bacterium]